MREDPQATGRMGSCPPSDLPHIAIFPFMSKGHTIPLLHLAHLLYRRRLAILTFFTTPLNADFLRRSLSGTSASIVELPFPHDVPGLPSGVESTDRLPSISYFLHFVRTAKQLQPHFESALQSLLPAVSLLISDGFFGWSNESASKMGIPRLVFYGMGNFSMAIVNVVIRDVLQPAGESISDDHQLFSVPRFPDVWLARAELGLHLDDPDGSHREFIDEQVKATRESRGIVVNSFYEMEPKYNDCFNSEFGPKAWCVGPLCLARPGAAVDSVRPRWIEWLDSRSAVNRPVLYVAFGTQAEVSWPQMEEIAAGLDGSGVDFLWVVREAAEKLAVGERAMVVREWVDQAEILAHESVRGFMSHCGWNSVMEAVAAGVPILAQPMMAEQHLNAILVVEVLGIGLRARQTRDNGLVRREELEEMARELMFGEKGKEASGKVRELAGAARKAVDEGGSSWRSLELMIHEVCKEKSVVKQNGE